MQQICLEYASKVPDSILSQQDQPRFHQELQSGFRVCRPVNILCGRRTTTCGTHGFHLVARGGSGADDSVVLCYPRAAWIDREGGISESIDLEPMLPEV